ncbi:MAG: HAMP domain-containing histidine kinase [candidate division Zixibacteria bacterium]|nr:HAMP domain-containing histidine kinase [candidate division Zixibacteria bacterium]
MVALIVTAVVVSLAGLVVVQLLLLANARQLKEQAFRDNAINAMQTVVRQLETREAASQVVRFAGLGTHGKAVQVMAVAVNDSALRQFHLDSSGALRLSSSQRPVWVDSGVLHYQVPSRGRVTIVARDSATGKSVTLVDTERAPGAYRLKLDDSLVASRSLFLRLDRGDTAAFGMRINCFNPPGQGQPAKDSNRMLIVSQVLDKLVMGETVPIEQRLDSTVLDSLLATSFASAGIDLEFMYAVISQDNDSVHLASAGLGRSAARTSDLATRLFPSDLLSIPATLVVVFPDRTGFVARQLFPLTAATTAFMIVISLCFIYSIVTIMRQRRFAQLTVDFINNMTHEFKTPLSTVGLACDALARPDIAANGDQVRRYESMIRDENDRMRSNVDKILQMAVLEEGDYELTISDIDLHAVIESAARGIALQVESRGGQLELRLAASPSLVAADPMHLSNIVANLLDNAAKYSTDSPHISLTTRVDGKSVILEVSDRGPGIAQRDLQHIFEKYYRVRTGNVHNVKGFGIGLSYVKLMTTAMGGTITLASEPGRGTTATLTLPLVG